MRGYKPGRFSFNVKGGRCEACKGDGHHQDRDALPARRVRDLRRVQGQALQPRDAGGPVQGQDHRRRPRHDASKRRCEFFENVPAHRATHADAATTSASATSSSASRRPRSRAARPSASSSPASWPRSPPAGRSTSSTSRPPACTSPTSEKLLEVLQRLVDHGNTVVVIEHNLDVIKTRRLDHRPGPEGGDEGGEVDRHRHARRRRARPRVGDDGAPRARSRPPLSGERRRGGRLRPSAASAPVAGSPSGVLGHAV